MLGVFAFFILPKEVKKAEENLALVFKDELNKAEIRRIIFELFKNLGQDLVELLYFPRINSQNIDRFVEAFGMDKVNRALQSGRGAIILSAHLGNWELLAAYFGLKGYGGTVIARRVRADRFNRLLHRLRQSKNIDTLYREDAFKGAVAVLRANRCLGIMPDQDMNAVEGVFVEFLGHPTYTPTGPINLALATGAPVFPCYIIRNKKNHKIIVEDPLNLTVSGDVQKDVLENTAKWSRMTESYIKRYPSQWVWMHNRWKTKPQ